jgi:hypothetical protein
VLALQRDCAAALDEQPRFRLDPERCATLLR